MLLFAILTDTATIKRRRTCELAFEFDLQAKTLVSIKGRRN